MRFTVAALDTVVVDDYHTAECQPTRGRLHHVEKRESES